MTSDNLDKKLQDVIELNEYGQTHSKEWLDSKVTQIKNCFADEGYHLDKHINVVLPEYMTGEEFLDRFIEELPIARHHQIPLYGYRKELVLRAATRAAGLDKL